MVVIEMSTVLLTENMGIPASIPSARLTAIPLLPTFAETRSWKRYLSARIALLLANIFVVLAESEIATQVFLGEM
jgi:hypothetical protein